MLKTEYVVRMYNDFPHKPLEDMHINKVLYDIEPWNIQSKLVSKEMKFLTSFHVPTFLVVVVVTSYSR